MNRLSPWTMKRSLCLHGIAPYEFPIGGYDWMAEMVKTLHNHYNPLSTFKENSSYWTFTQSNGAEAYSKNSLLHSSPLPLRVVIPCCMYGRPVSCKVSVLTELGK
jgi:hypothetical protein